VTFVQSLSRHGARDPTAAKSVAYGALVAYLQAQVSKYGEGFEWLKDYNYSLGADQLNDFGRQEMANSGNHFYHRYRHLARSVTPFIRTTDQDRMFDSAQQWSLGYHMARAADNKAAPDNYPYPMLVGPDGGAFHNNTLSHDLCTNFNSDPGQASQDVFMGTFAPAITARLKRNLVGAELADENTMFLMDLCPFDTVASSSGRISQFCNIFTEDEWHSYDYYQSLGKYYGQGFGNPLGPSRGVGWVNELIARLTGKPVQDHTSTNQTLDSSPKSFPLDSILYADFSHDNDMTGIFAAMGLFNNSKPLSKTTREDIRETEGWSAARTVPFGGRLFVEKMTCRESQNEELIRVLVNERVVPLLNCNADSLGRCELGKFIQSLEFARNGGHWDQCFT
jgi:hypothetical protein